MSDSAASEPNGQGLIDFLIRPLVQHPDDLDIKVVEGSASVLYELRVHADDWARVRGEDGSRLRAIQQVLSVASGSRKPVLDLVGADEDGAEE